MGGALDRRRFGKTGRMVTAVGLGGGEGILRTYGRHAEANAVIMEALDQGGIAYFDSAKAYAGGSEDYYGEVWRNRPRSQGTGLPGKQVGEQGACGRETDLTETLQRMGIETLDLWQIHDVRTFTDIREVEGGPSGALEAFVEARESGIVRQIGGVTGGHHDPDVLSHAVETWPVDAVMLPVNPVEEALGGGSWTRRSPPSHGSRGGSRSSG
ncbi:aldo/keto reductase [Methanoculleus chikugoensis]|uniref:aldo/keto reductase n=1 Tax=Methanoculleus chikugoensis TaxID=118126 RepID=UPI0006D18B4F|nr:aldo/keto reductase [Methanoculleus chikugoensis]